MWILNTVIIKGTQTNLSSLQHYINLHVKCKYVVYITMSYNFNIWHKIIISYKTYVISIAALLYVLKLVVLTQQYILFVVGSNVGNFLEYEEIAMW